MAVVYNNGVLTQTGTDSGLSVLSGHPGVTVRNYTLYSEYVLDNLTLQIEGTFTQKNNERLAFINGNTNAVRIVRGGVYNFGEQAVVTRDNNTTIDLNTGGHSLFIGKPTGTPYEFAHLGIRVLAGGAFNINGGSISSTKSISFDIDSIVKIRDGYINFDSQEGYQNFYMNSSNLDVVNLKVVDRSGLAKVLSGVRNNYIQFVGYEPIGLNFGIGTVDDLNFGLINVEKYAGGGLNGSDIRLRSTEDANEYRLHEATVGNGLIVTGHVWGGQSRGFVTHYIRFNPFFLSAVDSTAIEGAVYYITDKDNGNRRSPYSPGTQNYTGVSTVNGRLGSKRDILTGVWHNNGNNNVKGFTFDDRLGVAGNAIHYNYDISSISLTDSTIGEFSQAVLMPRDLLITEQDKSVVAAYTELSDAFMAYDYEKSKLVDGYLGQNKTYTTRVGNVHDCGSYNVIVDPNAPQVWDLTGNVLTIKRSTAGIIKTNGTVTVKAGVNLDNCIIEGTVILEANVATITNPTIVRLVIENSGTYTITGTGVTTIENTSSGVVNINAETAITKIETNGAINILDSFISFSGFTGAKALYANETDARRGEHPLGQFTTDDVYRFAFSAATAYYVYIDGVVAKATVVSAGESKLEFSVNQSLGLMRTGIDTLVSMTETTGESTRLKSTALADVPVADVSDLSVNVAKVAGSAVAGVDDFKAASVTLDKQQVRDAMALALSDGVTVANGSIDAGNVALSQEVFNALMRAVPQVIKDSYRDGTTVTLFGRSTYSQADRDEFSKLLALVATHSDIDALMQSLSKN